MKFSEVFGGAGAVIRERRGEISGVLSLSNHPSFSQPRSLGQFILRSSHQSQKTTLFWSSSSSDSPSPFPNQIRNGYTHILLVVLYCIPIIIFLFPNLVLPSSDPRIDGGKLRYSLGDTVNVNCTSPNSKPATDIEWLINGVKVSALLFPQVGEIPIFWEMK